MELEALQEVVPEIERLGASLVAVCPQRSEFLKKMKKDRGLTYPILRDIGNKTGALFGIRHLVPDYLREVYASFSIDLPRVNGEDSWSLSMPARYVVNSDGIIAAADFDPDYSIRPEPEKTVEDLKKLQALSA